MRSKIHSRAKVTNQPNKSYLDEDSGLPPSIDSQSGRRSRNVIVQRCKNTDKRKKPPNKLATKHDDSDSPIASASDDSDWRPCQSSSSSDAVSSDDNASNDSSIEGEAVADKPRSGYIKSRFTLPSKTSRKSVKSNNKQIKTESNKAPRGDKPVSKEENDDQVDESDDDWEDVVDNEGHQHSAKQEADLMHDLLLTSPDDDLTISKLSTSVDVTLSVSTKVVKPRSNKLDAASLASRQAKRQLADQARWLHSTNILCWLAASNWANRRCDSQLLQAVGLSLLHKSPLLPDVATKDYLSDCLEAIVTNCIGSDDDSSSQNLDPLNRIVHTEATSNDCIILFVGAMRALGFDTRLVATFRPLHVKPSSKSAKPPSSNTKDQNNDKSKKPKKPNRKIISSSDDDDFEEEAIEAVASNSSFFALLAEVYLPVASLWVSFEVADVAPRQAISSLRPTYAIGLTSQSDSPMMTYEGRNPVDLSGRYVPNYGLVAKSERLLPMDKWQSMLIKFGKLLNRRLPVTIDRSQQQHYQELVDRDEQDRRRLNEELRSTPMPDTLTGFHHHPVFVLKRHLLKYEIIHPVDAPVAGFFRNSEPVYYRDCVYLCHNRDYWLREAKVVRPNEKPVKLTSARMSFKRRLLDGDGKPPQVELFGPWQVTDYEPPVANNGKVPRNAHGNVDLFKPCMLPIGCVHVNLPGIHLIAKRLHIDCVAAVVGWTFHGAGWAHPTEFGHVVCKEDVSRLVREWRQSRLDAAKIAKLEREQASLDNWHRLVRGLFIWHRVKAQFAPLGSLPDLKPKAKSSKKPHRKSVFDADFNEDDRKHVINDGLEVTSDQQVATCRRKSSSTTVKRQRVGKSKKREDHSSNSDDDDEFNEVGVANPKQLNNDLEVSADQQSRLNSQLITAGDGSQGSRGWQRLCQLTDDNRLSQAQLPIIPLIDMSERVNSKKHSVPDKGRDHKSSTIAAKRPRNNKKKKEYYSSTSEEDDDFNEVAARHDQKQLTIDLKKSADQQESRVACNKGRTRKSSTASAKRPRNNNNKKKKKQEDHSSTSDYDEAFKSEDGQPTKKQHRSINNKSGVSKKIEQGAKDHVGMRRQTRLSVRRQREGK